MSTRLKDMELFSKFILQPLRKRKVTLWQQDVSQVIAAHPTLPFKDVIKKAKQKYKRLKKEQYGGAIRVNITKKPKSKLAQSHFLQFK